MIETVAVSVGRRKPWLHLPLRLCKFAMSLLGPLLNPFKRRSFMLQPKTLDTLSVHRWYSNEKAKSLLRWRPVYPMENALRLAIEAELREGTLRVYPCNLFVWGTFAILLLLGYLVFFLGR